MDKKGQVGLDMVRTFIIILMIVAVLGFITVVVMSSLGDTDTAINTRNQGETVDEVLANVVNGSGSNVSALTTSRFNNFNIVCTVNAVQNGTGGLIVPTSNFTTRNRGCTIVYTSVDGAFNNTAWEVNYSHTLDFNEVKGLTQNVSVGTADFFSNSSTWFSLLSVTIIIAIVVIVIFFVNRVGIVGGGGRSSPNF